MKHADGFILWSVWRFMLDDDLLLWKCLVVQIKNDHVVRVIDQITHLSLATANIFRNWFPVRVITFFRKQLLHLLLGVSESGDIFLSYVNHWTWISRTCPQTRRFSNWSNFRLLVHFFLIFENNVASKLEPEEVKYEERKHQDESQDCHHYYSLVLVFLKKASIRSIWIKQESSPLREGLIR